jgi:hypothetical protein
MDPTTYRPSYRGLDEAKLFGPLLRYAQPWVASFHQLRMHIGLIEMARDPVCGISAMKQIGIKALFPAFGHLQPFLGVREPGILPQAIKQSSGDERRHLVRDFTQAITTSWIPIPHLIALNMKSLPHLTDIFMEADHEDRDQFLAGLATLTMIRDNPSTGTPFSNHEIKQIERAILSFSG